jgi:hypothetical protein
LNFPIYHWQRGREGEGEERDIRLGERESQSPGGVLGVNLKLNLMALASICFSLSDVVIKKYIYISKMTMQYFRRKCRKRFIFV